MTAAPPTGGIGTVMTDPTDRYTDWSLDALVAEFALVRGDLVEPQARTQFIAAVLASAEVSDLVAAAYTEGRRVQASEIASYCRAQATKADPATGDHTAPTWWNGHNAALRQIAERQETRIAEAFGFPAASDPTRQVIPDRAAA